MINSIYLKNFKCFDELKISLGNVNLFTGLNGMGKSTLIQSILLLKQSLDFSDDKFHLNGKYTSLGNSQDIFFDKAVDDIIEFIFEEDNEKYSFSSLYKQDEGCLDFSRKTIVPTNFLSKIRYLNANRIIPDNFYGINNGKLDDFGINGEYSLQYFLENSNRELTNSKVLINDEKGNSLGNQTRLWLNKISPGAMPEINVDKEKRITTLAFSFIEGREKSKAYKNINVGFGLTYVLPVIISLLISKPGEILIIENPEAHIHPAGQCMLGELIARVASNNVQVFVETHSDHIINGIRVAVKNGLINSEKVFTGFFYKDFNDDFKHKYIDIKMFKNGKLSDWPEGFFDQWDNALLDLL